MIIWINGAFGTGKTTTSELLHQAIPAAHIFDPEDIGYIIQKTFPAARSLDYQDLAIWRKLVTRFIVEAKKEFPAPLIIPMTLVVPAYLEEIFSGIAAQGIPLFHFFLQTEPAELERRIKNQVIIPNNVAKDEEVRQWRLAQIDRCYAASAHMPAHTIFLDTQATPAGLVQLIRDTVGEI